MTTLVVGMVLVSLFAAGGTGAEASTPFVTAQVRPMSAMTSLLRGRLGQTVTCRESCNVIARIFIRPQVARQLGFKRVTAGQSYAVGLRQVRLASGRPTRVVVALGPDARKRLPKWKRTLQLFGETYAGSTTSDERGQANWVTTLRR
jgi:hypothetical protein